MNFFERNDNWAVEQLVLIFRGIFVILAEAITLFSVAYMVAHVLATSFTSELACPATKAVHNGRGPLQQKKSTETPRGADDFLRRIERRALVREVAGVGGGGPNRFGQEKVGEVDLNKAEVRWRLF